jgi:hypothetical protein
MKTENKKIENRMSTGGGTAPANKLHLLNSFLPDRLTTVVKNGKKQNYRMCPR